MTRSRISFAFLIATVCLLANAAVVRAQDASIDVARQHFDQGQRFYTANDYTKAADEFLAAYTAKPFAAFLFNAAVCREKGKEYKEAVKLFRRYLDADPKAGDRVDVEKRIAVIEAELSGPPPASQPTSQPVGTPPTGVAALPEAKTKGVVYIESKPAEAVIYIDTKNKAEAGKTPYSDTIEGRHTIILESRGYKTAKREENFRPGEIYHLYFELSEEHFLGWLEVRANPSDADVYLDRRDVGAIGKTPFRGNVQPGKHRLIIAKKGYKEVVKDIEIIRGESQNVDVVLEVSPIGFVQVKGESAMGGKVKLDGKLVCEKAPCRFEAPQGEHKVSVSKGGKKTYTRTLDLSPRTETTLNVKLADTPSRTDAIWQFVLSAVFITGGALSYHAYSEDNCPFFTPEEDDPDTMVVECDDNPTTPERDCDKGQRSVCQYTAFGLFGLGAITTATGIYYLVRDKGPPSTGTIDQQDITWGPSIGPDFAGIGAAVSW